MSENNKTNAVMNEKRRDNRIPVDLPFLLTEADGDARWVGETIDISPTGILLRIEEAQAPPPGKILNVMVQGPAEKGWEHINKRPARVVRVQENETGLTYTDLDAPALADESD